MRVARPGLLEAVPAAVRGVVERLEAAGGRAWLVGGTVRDLLLGRAPRDHDVATDLHPGVVGGLFEGGDTADARFGVVRVGTGELLVGITTLRADGGYADRRHPDAVEFVDTPERDAPRRDFTVNGLYYDLGRGEVIDHVGGLLDLDARRLRTIGPPAARLAEDPLRLLRLVRFAARGPFAIDGATEAAARATAPELAALAPERVFRELSDMFTGPGRGDALRLFVGLGLAAVVLPEVAAMDGVTQPPEYHPEGDVLTHVALVLDAVPPDDPILAWAALLHDVGKPKTWRLAEDRIRFDGHDCLSADMAEQILARFRVGRRLTEQVVAICRDHIRFASLPQMRPRRRERWLREPGFARHLAFHRADCLGSHGKLDVFDFAAGELERLPPVQAPLVTGRDVLALGIDPGPRVGELLARVHAAAEESPVAMDRARALVLLREIAGQDRQDRGRKAR